MMEMGVAVKLDLRFPRASRRWRMQGAAHLLPSSATASMVYCAGHERIEGQLAAGDIGQTRLVAVGVGARRRTRRFPRRTPPCNGQRVGADVGHGHELTNDRTAR